MTLHSPAEVIANLLINNSQGTDPTDSGDWPIYIDLLPDSERLPTQSANAPDNAIAVMDTSPIQDGRDHTTGETVSHPGIQISLRSKQWGYREGWVKITAIKGFLDTVLRENVSLTVGGSATYKVHAVTVASGPVALGLDDKRRNLFTLNVIITITQES